MFKDESEFKKVIDGLNIDTGPDPKHREELRREVLSVFNKTAQQSQKRTTPLGVLRRKIMKSPVTKIAAAAVIIITGILAVNLFDQSVPTAYAIEQTVEASRNLRFIHLKNESAGTGGKGVDEMWAAFDAEGNLQRLRMNFPNPADGPKDVIWQEGKAAVWFKAKQRTAVVREKNMLARLKMSYRDFDPKVLGEELCRIQAQDANQITIKESHSDDDPITITETRNGVRTIYKVDPKTKLLLQYENYVLKNGDYKFAGRTLYLDYNQPIDPSIFIFDLPTQDVGMAKGALSDEQIAVELTRQFIHALIDEDYDKIEKLLAYPPGAWAEQRQRFAEMFAEVKLIRLVSIGKPESQPERGGLRVPCQVEIEKDGKSTIQPIAPCTQQLYGQPERWQVISVF